MLFELSTKRRNGEMASSIYQSAEKAVYRVYISSDIVLIPGRLIATTIPLRVTHTAKSTQKKKQKDRPLLDSGFGFQLILGIMLDRRGYYDCSFHRK